MRRDPPDPGTSLSRRQWLGKVVRILGGSLVAAWVAPHREVWAEGSTKRSAPPGRPEDKMDFRTVVVGDHVSNPCTPDLPDEFLGIRINAPARVVSGVDRFVVCGTYRFPVEYIRKFGSIHWAVVLVIVGSQSHRPYACNLIPPGATPEPVAPSTVTDPPWMTGHRVRRYFNVDLLELLEDFPRRTGEYFVYALIEDHVSNVVRVSFQA